MKTAIQRTEELVIQARAGNEGALARLYDLYAERVQWMVRLRLSGQMRSKLDSMDVVQDAMMNAFRGLDRFTYEKEGDFLRWLSKIAENAFLNHANRLLADKRDIRREVARQHAATGEQSEPLRIREPFQTVTPSRVLANREDLNRLEKALGTLKPEYREVITLTKLQGRSYQEIGVTMNKSPDAVRMLAVRGMAALTAAFGKVS